MKYVLHILTSESQVRIDKFIQEGFDKLDITGIQAEYHKNQWMKSIKSYYNGEMTSETSKVYDAILGPLNTTLIVKTPQAVGYQTQPRVKWLGHVRKINDIDECISFRRIHETNKHSSLKGQCMECNGPAKPSCQYH